jgi:SAM-dependent methyltransferase
VRRAPRRVTAPATSPFPSAPLVGVERVDACPVCAGSESTPYACGYDYELGTCANRWTFVRCTGCGHVWLNPRPAVAALETIYPPHYYAYNYRDVVNPFALRAKERLDSIKLRGILRALGRTPASVLDVGCGDGRYLRQFNRLDVPADACFGLELDRAAVDRLAESGYPVYCERVEDTDKIPERGIDLITMFHVIEHVDDPARVVTRLRNWLAPDGLLALETPNIESLDERLFHESFWGGYHIPRHWNLFSQKTIGDLMHRCGFEVVALRYQTGHSFWMYSIHHRLRYGPHAQPRLANFFDPMRNVVPLAAFTGFDTVRARIGAKTSAMLVLARARRD